MRGGGVQAVLCAVLSAGVPKSAALPAAGVLVAVTLGPGPWRWSSLISTSGVFARILCPGRPQVDIVCFGVVGLF